MPVHELGVDAKGCRFFTKKRVRGSSLDEILDPVRSGIDGESVTRAVAHWLCTCEATALTHG